MVHVTSKEQFAQFLAATSSPKDSGDGIYNVDLDVTTINASNSQEDLFSMLGCEEGTVFSNCGCASNNWTLCC